MTPFCAFIVGLSCLIEFASGLDRESLVGERIVGGTLVPAGKYPFYGRASWFGCLSTLSS